jgi:hypothetical protein
LAVFLVSNFCAIDILQSPVKFFATISQNVETKSEEAFFSYRVGQPLNFLSLAKAPEVF